jgi:hypothetical protein
LIDGFNKVCIFPKRFLKEVEWKAFQNPTWVGAKKKYLLEDNLELLFFLKEYFTLDQDDPSSNLCRTELTL